jgi:ubiquinone biosynthesis protein
VTTTSKRLTRHLQVARVMWRHGPDLLRGTEYADDLGGGLANPDDGDGGGSDPERLAADLESLGPTFIKLGQLLASRPDLLPPAHLDALAALRDDVAPESFDVIRDVIESELGVRLSNAFSRFDETPLASASLGQVHRAALRDGREVAVKVQRPGLREQLRTDLRVLEDLATAAEQVSEQARVFRLVELVDEFRQTLGRELDYRREASNLEALGEALADFDRLVVPRYVPDFSSARVLTMEFIPGIAIGSAGPLARLEVDGAELMDEFFHAYIRQVLANGFVHADPHPGNVLITPDDRLALLDAGMVVRLERTVRERLLRLLVALSEGDAEEVAASALALGERGDGFDETAFERGLAEIVGRAEDLHAEDHDLGMVLVDVVRIAGATGLHIPTDFVLLARTVLSLEAVSRELAPEFDVNAALRRHLTAVASESMLEQLRPSAAMRTLLEAKELTEQLPGRVNAILGNLADGELRLKVDAIDEAELMRSIRKIANRVTAGLVLAALIVGAAMMLRVETESTLFGYPALAIVFFLLAAGGGFALVVSVLWGDRQRR